MIGYSSRRISDVAYLWSRRTTRLFTKDYGASRSLLSLKPTDSAAAPVLTLFLMTKRNQSELDLDGFRLLYFLILESRHSFHKDDIVLRSTWYWTKNSWSAYYMIRVVDRDDEKRRQDLENLTTKASLSSRTTSVSMTILTDHVSYLTLIQNSNNSFKNKYVFSAVSVIGRKIVSTDSELATFASTPKLSDLNDLNLSFWQIGVLGDGHNSNSLC